MPTPDYSTYYAASTGAGGALIGLLFVSVSLAPERTVQATAPWERRAAATSAFSALANAFFVSFGALLPTTNLGGFALVLGATAWLTAIGLTVDLIRTRQGWPETLRRFPLVGVGLVVYAYECWNGLQLLHHRADADAQQAIALIVLGVYALGLARAWELLGAQHGSVIGWAVHLAGRDGATASHESAVSAPDREPAQRPS